MDDIKFGIVFISSMILLYSFILYLNYKSKNKVGFIINAVLLFVLIFIDVCFIIEKI